MCPKGSIAAAFKSSEPLLLLRLMGVSAPSLHRKSADSLISHLEIFISNHNCYPPAGNDYNDTVVTTVIFPSSVNEIFYPVPIVNDNNIESNESFTVKLSTTESNVNIGNGTATVTIVDEDSELLIYKIKYV